MDVFNKVLSQITTSVHSSVQIANTILPGNPLIREYDQIEHISSGGIGLLWKIFKGIKKSTKQEAAIWVFEKNQLEKFNKDDREQILEILRRGVIQLTKIRHPHVLTVQHALEESRDSIVFATEPVLGSLANILGNYHNMPHPNTMSSHKLHDVDVKYGLIQICEGLGFLHSEVKLLHRNICPESIIVNSSGSWKIFSFDYCVMNSNPHEAKPYWIFTEYNSTWHALSQPSLEFAAPENALISSHSSASDIFSLGVLIYCLYSNGKPIKMFGKDFQSFKRYAGELKQGKYPNLSIIPEGLQNQIKLCLNAVPEMRPNIHEFTKIPYFDDVGVKTLTYLENLFQWDNLQKSKFYKGLPQVLSKLPHRINLHRILPCLVKEFVNPPMIPFVLPNVLLIAEQCTNQEYVKNVLHHLKPVMKISEPIQILLIFMQKMDLLLKLTPAEDVKTDVLPMLYRALESDAQQIQEICLSILPTFASLVDYPAMKNSLLPRIKKLCINTTLISVRVNCLMCIGKLLEHLDKWLVQDEIIPFLPQIPSREPAVIMAILGIYKISLTHSKLGLTKETCANKVIPFLVPLSIENGLSLAQFNAMMSLIKEIVTKVETEHRSKLEQLTSIQKESNTLKHSFDQSFVNVKSPTKTDVDDVFSNLGLESFLNSSDDSSNGTSGNGSSSLNLQEKQRLVLQQEQNHRHQTQSAITPTEVPQRIINKPKDLTSSLLDSNLSQLKLTHNSSNNNTWFNNNTTNNNFSTSHSATGSLAKSPSNQWGESNNSNKNNWGAFDDLVPSTNKAAKVPLNQMTNRNTNPPAPLLMHSTNNNTYNKSIKGNNNLSADDIMEFLK